MREVYFRGVPIPVIVTKYMIEHHCPVCQRCTEWNKKYNYRVCRKCGLKVELKKEKIKNDY